MSAVQKHKAKAEARRILQSPHFFAEFLKAVEKAGLVGEARNALVLLIVVVSRLLDRPLNAVVKGASSAGKNWLVRCVLKLVPSGVVREVTSVSTQALNYMKDAFVHCVVYIQERNEATGAVHPTRLLISEGKLIRYVTSRVGGRFTTQKYVTKGPIACISTSSKPLEIDDQTRHVFVPIDESPIQTARIAQRFATESAKLTSYDRSVWHYVHRLLESRIGAKFELPKWFGQVAAGVATDDIRTRRYFPAFVEMCKVVCLIRSFQRKANKQVAQLRITFADFAIAALIFEDVFVESLHPEGSLGFDTRRALEYLSKTNGGRPIDARTLAKHLGISLPKAYRRLREAAGTGMVRQVNTPEKGNRKLFRAVPVPRFLPDPKQLFEEVLLSKRIIRFVHPLIGEMVTYRKGTTRT